MIRLYDTMAREKRAFEPLNPERITMYVCGPTVYGRAHIGNARPAVVFDTLSYGYSEGAMVGIRVMVLDEDLTDARRLFLEYQP